MVYVNFNGISCNLSQSSKAFEDEASQIYVVGTHGNSRNLFNSDDLIRMGTPGKLEARCCHD